MLQVTGEYTKKLKEAAEDRDRKLLGRSCLPSPQTAAFRSPLPQHHAPAPEPLEEPTTYQRSGQTPPPTARIDPRDLYTGGGQHSLAK
ncbi:hypothetical protein JCM10295v2_004605 [Rhodotorula toruloides]